ncbi:hypothetical protein UFOVP1246_40 [uncultured Caudovirales phage]|uniref:Uncharacterized protein n=1 Tax=uncultured Caudovirales phage TaxID=2100421 RepID=A0A6J5RLF5_9CAUD|nr:hypothetical protein UFOVP1246_40 [uncultured Caudovirales phage]
MGDMHFATRRGLRHSLRATRIYKKDSGVVAGEDQEKAVHSLAGPQIWPIQRFDATRYLVEIAHDALPCPLHPLKSLSDASISLSHALYGDKYSCT